MRILPSLFLAGLLLTGASSAFAKTPTGEKSPQFSVVDTLGQTQSLEALRGKTVILSGPMMAALTSKNITLPAICKRRKWLLRAKTRSGYR